jgi:hypothetical protein
MQRLAQFSTSARQHIIFAFAMPSIADASRRYVGTKHGSASGKAKGEDGVA